MSGIGVTPAGNGVGAGGLSVGLAAGDAGEGEWQRIG